MNRACPLWFCFLGLIGAGSPVFAHDYWLAPATYRPAVGDKFDVRLLVGDKFISEIERSLQKPRTVSFRLVDKDGKARDLLRSGRKDQKPVAQLVLPGQGTFVLAMQRDWAVIEMKAKKFHEYLEHEGLQRVIQLRKAAGEADKPAKERYRRYLKSVLRGDGVASSTWRRRLGHKLEILPLEDPSGVTPGDSLPVRVLFQSKPLVGAQVSVFGRQGKKVTVHAARTDARGRVSLKIDHPGEWVVRLVYLRRCPEKKEADWESFWSAMTFGVTE